MRLLLIDNNDSFTYNLYHQIVRVTGLHTDVVPYDSLYSCGAGSYSGYVISPGPGHPDEYMDYEFLLESEKPVFGVCLGMQIMNSLFGGKTDRLKDCRHGITLPAEYRGETHSVAVYNSLYCSMVPDCFEIISRYKNTPMGIIHKTKPIAGVQFHPESFMSLTGDFLLKDVLSSIGII